MTNERRSLVREIRKALCELSADELFFIAKNIEQINEREESKVFGLPGSGAQVQ